MYLAKSADYAIINQEDLEEPVRERLISREKRGTPSGGEGGGLGTGLAKVKEVTPKSTEHVCPWVTFYVHMTLEP